MKYLLEFTDEAAARFSQFLAAGTVGYADYAGMTEVRVCDKCSAVVTDLRHHLDRAHDETYSDEAWDFRYGG